MVVQQMKEPSLEQYLQRKLILLFKLRWNKEKFILYSLEVFWWSEYVLVVITA